MRKQLLSLALRGQRALAQQQQAGTSAPALALRSFADDANLKKTPFYDFHVEHGGRSQRRAPPAAPRAAARAAALGG